MAIAGSEGPVTAFFGLDTGSFYSTGAAGSPGDTAAESAPGVLARVPASTGDPYRSGQAELDGADPGMVTVTPGDTSGMSSDQPYGQDHSDDFSGVRLDYPGDAGGFQVGPDPASHVAGPRHPNAAMGVS